MTTVSKTYRENGYETTVTAIPLEGGIISVRLECKLKPDVTISETRIVPAQFALEIMEMINRIN